MLMAERSFLELLLIDVANATERHTSSGTQSDKRDLVRTTFAAIEGVAWIFREHVTGAARDSYGLDPGEEGALNEIAFQVSETGKIHRRHSFMPLLNSIRLTARIGARIAPSKRIDFSGGGWDDLRKAIVTRNRITHPKGVKDLILTDGDIETGTTALFWLLAETTEVMEETNSAIADYLGEFRLVLDKLLANDPEMHALYRSVEKQLAED